MGRKEESSLEEYDGEKGTKSQEERERNFKINIASEQLFMSSFVSSYSKYFLLNLQKLHSAQLPAKLFPCQTCAGSHQTFVKSKFGWGKKSPEHGERERNTAG